jgi:hypothetical protein
MDKLRFIVSLYCDKKNLVYESYMDGLLKNGELSHPLIETLCKYHKEWMK